MTAKYQRNGTTTKQCKQPIIYDKYDLKRQQRTCVPLGVISRHNGIADDNVRHDQTKSTSVKSYTKH